MGAVTCMSCMNFRAAEVCAIPGQPVKTRIDCRVKGWTPQIPLAMCKEDSACRDPGVDEEWWDEDD